MANIYTIRAILDSDEDVIRDLSLGGNASLYDLHQLLVKAFNLDPGEMSSFFRSNDDWNQGEEISMMDFDPETNTNSLDTLSIGECFEKVGSKMLFVYDYLHLWTFYLEASAMREHDQVNPEATVLGGIGQRPEQPPQREMKAEDNEDPLSEWDMQENEDEDDHYQGDDWY